MGHSANSTLFGFGFQTGAAIVLFLENVKEVEGLRFEGESEDIELKLKNGKKILAQAKSIVNSKNDFHNCRRNLTKAICTLSEADKNENASELIYITNTTRPFYPCHLKEQSDMFTGNKKWSFDSLPEEYQDVVNKILSEKGKSLNTSILKIYTLPYGGDNDKTKYCYIYEAINDFLAKCEVTNQSLATTIREKWFSTIYGNGEKLKAENEEIIKKEELIWILIVECIGSSLDRNLIENDHTEEEIREIEELYKMQIDTLCSQGNIVSRILSDYFDYDQTIRANKRRQKFVEEKWPDYIEELSLDNNVDDTVKETVTKIVMSKIINNNRTINSIRKEADL